ncbi:MAG: tyrosine-type recombinase/integrase [Verrucomicrobiales bacterium]|nr:tyrosine-type recombinase/integrase [Verrucomicrobiales bacterium]
MIFHVFKPSRIRNGKRIRVRTYSGKYQLPGDPKPTQVALGVTDKQVAQAKLRDIVRKKERIAAGLERSETSEETLNAPISETLDRWISDLHAKGRTTHYVGIMEKMNLALFRANGWECVSDINARDFLKWRADNQDKAPKTLNEYLNACRGFLNWLVRIGDIEGNPLDRVEKVETRGRETRVRRAITHQEFLSLLSVSPFKRRIGYAAAYYTGLRKSELNEVRWEDLELETENPIIRARASTTKNKKTEALPLHPDLVQLLITHKHTSSPSSESERVFAIADRLHTFRTDLKSAGIPFEDDSGNRFDFHALRHTFATLLANGGAALPMAMKAMRHSEPSLTAKTYTDANALQLAPMIEQLPGMSENVSQIDSPDSVSSAHLLSSPDTNVGDIDQQNPLVKSQLGHDLSQTDTTSHSKKMAPPVGFEPTT